MSDTPARHARTKPAPLEERLREYTEALRAAERANMAAMEELQACYRNGEQPGLLVPEMLCASNDELARCREREDRLAADVDAASAVMAYLAGPGYAQAAQQPKATPGHRKPRPGYLKQIKITIPAVPAAALAGAAAVAISVPGVITGAGYTTPPAVVKTVTAHDAAPPAVAASPSASASPSPAGAAPTPPAPSPSASSASPAVPECPATGTPASLPVTITPVVLPVTVPPVVQKVVNAVPPVVQKVAAAVPPVVRQVTKLPGEILSGHGHYRGHHRRTGPRL